MEPLLSTGSIINIVDLTYRLNGEYTIIAAMGASTYYEIKNPETNTIVLVPVGGIGRIEGFTDSEFGKLSNDADGVLKSDVKSHYYGINSHGKPFYHIKKITTPVYVLSNSRHVPVYVPMDYINTYIERTKASSAGGRRKNRRATKKARKHRSRTNRRLSR